MLYPSISNPSFSFVTRFSFILPWSKFVTGVDFFLLSLSTKGLLLECSLFIVLSLYFLLFGVWLNPLILLPFFWQKMLSKSMSSLLSQLLLSSSLLRLLLLSLFFSRLALQPAHYFLRGVVPLLASFFSSVWVWSKEFIGMNSSLVTKLGLTLSLLLNVLKQLSKKLISSCSGGPLPFL